MPAIGASGNPAAPACGTPPCTCTRPSSEFAVQTDACNKRCTGIKIAAIQDEKIFISGLKPASWCPVPQKNKQTSRTGLSQTKCVADSGGRYGRDVACVLFRCPDIHRGDYPARAAHSRSSQALTGRSGPMGSVVRLVIEPVAGLPDDRSQPVHRHRQHRRDPSSPSPHLPNFLPVELYLSQPPPSVEPVFPLPNHFLKSSFLFGYGFLLKSILNGILHFFQNEFKCCAKSRSTALFFSLSLSFLTV